MAQASPQARIAEIDKAIDGVLRELRRRERIRPLSAASSQKAWDKHPALHDEYKALFYRRGFLQLVRDNVDYKAVQAHRRRERAKQAAVTRLHTEMRRNGLAVAA